MDDTICFLALVWTGESLLKYAVKSNKVSLETIQYFNEPENKAAILGLLPNYPRAANVVVVDVIPIFDVVV